MDEQDVLNWARNKAKGKTMAKKKAAAKAAKKKAEKRRPAATAKGKGKRKAKVLRKDPVYERLDEIAGMLHRLEGKVDELTRMQFPAPAGEVAEVHDGAGGDDDAD